MATRKQRQNHTLLGDGQKVTEAAPLILLHGSLTVHVDDGVGGSRTDIAIIT